MSGEGSVASKVEVEAGMEAVIDEEDGTKGRAMEVKGKSQTGMLGQGIGGLIAMELEGHHNLLLNHHHLQMHQTHSTSDEAYQSRLCYLCKVLLLWRTALDGNDNTA